MLMSSAAFAQNGTTVTGTVFDTDGETIIGATVKEKGNDKNATVTDMDGAFTLKTASKNPTLVISYLGCVTQEVHAQGGQVKVTLQSDQKEIDEVVVVGYGTQRKANLTGSVASLSSKEIADIPAANSASLLQGRLLGRCLDKCRWTGW